MKSKLKIVSLIATLIIILGLLCFGIHNTVHFNSEKNSVSYTSLDLFPEEPEETCISARLLPNLKTENPEDLWSSIINDDDTVHDEPNYESLYYDLAISNISNHKVDSYAIRVSFSSKSYLFTGWCGSFEIHQFRDGQELVQTIDMDDRPTTLADYEIEAIFSYDKYIFPMLDGDYFLFLPYAEKGMVPLAKEQSVYPGFILLEKMGETPSMTAKQEIRNIRITKSTASVKDDREVTFQMEARNDGWEKIVDPKHKGITEPDYMGQTYDLKFKNNTKHTLQKYSLTFTLESFAYLSNAWNGSVEIHQGDKTLFIEDLRSFTPDASCPLEYIQSGSDVLIPLNSGDSFTYYPSEESLESPLASAASTTAGVILYQKIGSEIYGSAVLNLEYHMGFFEEPLFLCSFIFLMVWLVVLIFEVLLQIRLSSFKRQKEHQEKIIVESIETFTSFIDAKDPYTNGHSHRVAYYTKLIAEQIGYSEEDVQRIYYIGLLHDCGKIGIPDSILGKPSRLTLEEYNVIKSHSVRGAQILENFKSLEGVREGVLYHHERYDGKGYPEGKSGTDIPLDARIICVADSFDAMNSDRCYRERLTKDEIIHEFETNKGTQFDPELADVMVFLILSGKIVIEA